jgi:hypothetical protein
MEMTKYGENLDATIGEDEGMKGGGEGPAYLRG